jgi:hypothetical protein
MEQEFAYSCLGLFETFLCDQERLTGVLHKARYSLLLQQAGNRTNRLTKILLKSLTTTRELAGEGSTPTS